VGDAVELIRHGRADMIVAGGVEGLIHETAIGSFARMNALSTRNDEPTRAIRPFDNDRDGTVISEGAGVMILERLDHALARNAHIYAEVMGCATSSDAFHITSPDPQGAGAVRAMKWALEDAGVTPEQIDYINAHGTATRMNDAMETEAVKQLFGEYAYQVPISSSKSVLGHAMGATGALEAIFCIYALNHQIAPPTWNYETPDPACDLDYVPNAAIERDVRNVISNSFGFGGHNSSLVFSRHET
jgi:3-oxoacyl-(acyl-carrier-protein) synthase